ncbi:sensor histidine kinase [Paenibacillus sp. TRM 82003]|nr:sensor histidine kinase [Paenibacillus sp. TRM 82003]
MNKLQEPPSMPIGSPSILHDARKLIIIWLTLVFVGTLLQHYHEIDLVQNLPFAATMFLHALLHWHAAVITSKSRLIYISVQGILVYATAFFVQPASFVVLLGLLPILMAQSFGLYYRSWKFATVSSLYIFLFIVSTVKFSGVEGLHATATPFILMSLTAVGIADLTLRQYHARARMQVFLSELEQAHRKVEELTVANERQRIARDLHDTLAQGLVGLLMQLEAVEEHLSNGNTCRAQEIIKQSRSRARQTLSEARQAIDDLRSLSSVSIDLAEAIRKEIARFHQATGITVATAIDILGELPKLLLEHGGHIIRECLNNIARHAEAKQVQVNVTRRGDRLYLSISDDGKGFDLDTIGKKSGHYGIIGIQERVRILGGKLTIDSGQNGTRVEVQLPVPAGKEESS